MTTYHILLIEDDPGIAGSLQTALIRDGYRVHWKDRGTEGVEYACEHNPHLIILDVRLPDGSGFDFCRQMRQSGVHQPVIILTVHSDEVDKVLGLEMGADDYMTKPFSLRELLSRVRAQIRRSYGELAVVDSDMLYAGDLVIDRRRGNVMRGGKIINVTPTELRLLTYLAQHPNQVLSRGQILDAVWGSETSPDTEQVVTVNIRRLREKIELNPSDPDLVLTVPGIGYKLVS
ncbi:MAG TPA: response regulator transcription factor [Aggregatilinea sp.]|jgi:DNA-binding response OmpR family regulator|uniref:response regulator transcription factor n=1 Tax=Aggregatilinea sp. TaxID=2806333 RepID=UPI002C656AB9|nr:response regulator transcription factor [Aggregatilinea sp.]HML20512.1 response regulator transcription factor [Aggregatilinea sp.]